MASFDLGTGRITQRISDLWWRFMAGGQDVAGRSAETAEPPLDLAETLRAHAPVIWLLGKVQSGKSSVARAITGAAEAQIGSGFKACTKTATVFDFPAEAPLVRFLDTRGLGEAGYDADEDIAFCEDRAHLVLVTMRAMDAQQRAVVDVVADVRRRHPDWPVVVAQTSLHEALSPGGALPAAYPFDADGRAGPECGLPADLIRMLAHQRSLFDGVSGSGPLRFVPIDFTRPEDGAADPDYGLDALRAAIADVAPAALAANVQNLRNGAEAAGDGDRRLHALILGHATAAGAADVVPLPGVGIVAVTGIQAKLLRDLATRRGAAWDRRTLGEFAGCLGAGVLTRLAAGMGTRQLAKLIPVYGQTIGLAAAGASSFAATYALGKAADYFLQRRGAGLAPGTADVAARYRDALAEALRMRRPKDDGAPDGEVAKATAGGRDGS